MSIRKFRKRMKPFILIITVVFLLSLAFGGYQSFQSSRANKKAQEAFTLNGENINKIEIEREKSQIADLYQKNTDINLNKDLIDILAFNQVIEKKLVLELAKKLKIKVSSSEVNEEYESIENSIGDKAQFKRMLEFQGFTKASYKDKIEEELLTKKTIENFTDGVKPTEKEIEDFYQVNVQDKSKSLVSLKEKIINAIKTREGTKKYLEAITKLKKEAKIKDVAKEYENLVEKEFYEEDEIKITNLDFSKESLRQILNAGKGKKLTKEEIEKNTKLFISKEIKLIRLAKEKGIIVNENLPFANKVLEYRNGLLEKYREEVKVSDKDLKEFFNANKARYRVNASADASMVFIAIKDSKEDDKLAKEKAEEVLKEINKNNFDQKGKALAKEKGYIYEDLGTFNEGTMVKEFEEAVKETVSGEISKNIVRTGFGYHIIFVKENNSRESKWTASHILVRIEPSQKTISEKLVKINKLKENLENGTIKFSEIQKLDEDVIQDVKIDGISPDGNIPNIGYNKEITDKIFAEKLGKVGMIRENLMVILFQKTKEVKAEKPNFEKSKEIVKSDFINYKALKKMMKTF